jgi:tRNA pseudouridine55 synthase
MTDPNQPPPLNVSGIVLVDKPATRAVSSMTVVRAVKRKFMAAGYPKRLKVGHAGTLDPLASGLMIVLVGKATRLCDAMMAREKRYLTDIDFSRWSPTDDLEAETIACDFSLSSIPLPPIREQLEAVITSRFLGTIQQRPPSYSAIWVEGKRSFDLARAGKPPELPERPIDIHSIDVLEYSWPHARLDVRCGKGTYIRSLARDLGAALTGQPALLVGLRRTEIGAYDVVRATKLDELPERMTEADLLSPPETSRDADSSPVESAATPEEDCEQ